MMLLPKCGCAQAFHCCLLVFSTLTTMAIAQLRQERNDPRCTPIKYILRYWEGYNFPFAYDVSSNSELFQGTEIHNSSMAYDEAEKRCFAKLRSICSKDADCDKRAKCSRHIFPDLFYGAPDDPRKIDPAINPLIGLCVCAEGKVKNVDGTKCLDGAFFGQTCDDVTRPCLGENVECLNNRCSCPPRKAVTRVNTEYGANETYYYAVLKGMPYEGNTKDIIEFPRSYDEKTGKCTIQGNGPCLGITNECSSNKTCSSSWSPGFGTFEGDEDNQYVSRHPLLGRCSCYGFDRPAVLDPKTDMCFLLPTYGETCNELLTCNPSSLECKNGRCTCPNEEHIYDDSDKSCVAKLGSKCTYGTCIANANCKYSSGSHNEGVCTCKNGFVGSNGTCYAQHMTECESNGAKCSPDGFLKCVDGYCKCGEPLSQVYDSIRSECFALVGSKCSDPSSSTKKYPTCVEGAFCSDGICRCHQGLSANDGQCEPFRGDGARCWAGSCSYKDGWACIDGLCRCIDPRLKVEQGKCVSRVGSYCGNVENVGKKDTEIKYQKFYYVGCDDDGICDTNPSEGKSICKKAIKYNVV